MTPAARTRRPSRSASAGRLLIAWAFAAASLAAAAPELPPSITKEAIDKAAVATGRWPRADYPFYGKCNGCGTENLSVPERPYRIKDISFAPACNAHDQRYCTLGMSRAEADRLFREDLGKIVDAWLDSRVADSILPDELLQCVEWRAVRDWIGQLPAPQTSQETTEESAAVVLTFEPVIEPTWFSRKLTTTKQHLADCWDCVIVVKEMCELAVDEAGARIWSRTEKSNREDLTPGELETILKWVDTYADTVEAFGESSYEEAQAQQRAYEAWLTEFLDGRSL